jgi:hypothetical protein
MNQWFTIILLAYVTVDGHCSQREVGFQTDNRGEIFILLCDSIGNTEYQFHAKKKGIVDYPIWFEELITKKKGIVDYPIWFEELITKEQSKQCVPANYFIQTQYLRGGNFTLTIKTLQYPEETYFFTKRRGRLTTQPIFPAKFQIIHTIQISSLPCKNAQP